MLPRHFVLTLSGALLALLFFVFLGIRHYDMNVSALFHMDVPFGEQHDVPPGLILYEDAAYDGMLYYQVTRDIPALFTDGKTSLDSPYRFQRILLPLLVFAVTLGQESLFPAAFLTINILASLGALALLLLITKKTDVHTISVIANPAILVGVLYSLTEPLSMFFIMLFLYLWENNNYALSALSLLALLLSLFARETTVFLMGPLFLWYLWKRQWLDVLLLTIPGVIFVLWQYFLVLRLGDVAFQATSNFVSLPLSGPLTLIVWHVDRRSLF